MMILVPLYLLAALATTARAAIFTDKTEKLREAATAIETIGNVDVLTMPADDGEGSTEEIGVCHIPTFLPFVGGKLFPLVQVAIATHLAIQHLNDGDGSIVSELEGLNDRCDIRFTTEMIDTMRSPSVAVDGYLQAHSEKTICAVMGAARSPVTIPLAILTGIHDVPQSYRRCPPRRN